MNRIIFILILFSTFSLNSFSQSNCDNLQDYKKFRNLKKAMKNKEDVKYLNLSSKKLVEFPEDIFELDSLEILILNNNDIAVIPDRISELKNLKFLYIMHNPIERIPNSIIELKKLERLFFIDSKIKETDADFFRQKMPNCLILLEFTS